METITIFTNNYQNQFIVKVESNGQTVIFDGKSYINKVPKTFEQIEIKDLSQWKQETIETYINEAMKTVKYWIEFKKDVEQKKKEYKAKDKPFRKSFNNLIRSIETL